MIWLKRELNSIKKRNESTSEQVFTWARRVEVLRTQTVILDATKEATHLAP